MPAEQDALRPDIASQRRADAEVSEGADRGHRPVDSGRVSPVDPFVHDVVTCTLGLVALACIE